MYSEGVWLVTPADEASGVEVACAEVCGTEEGLDGVGVGVG